MQSKPFNKAALYAVNGFELFPEILCSLTSLETLILTSQQLGELPQSLSQLTRLSQLVING